MHCASSRAACSLVAAKRPSETSPPPRLPIGCAFCWASRRCDAYLAPDGGEVGRTRAEAWDGVRWGRVGLGGVGWFGEWRVRVVRGVVG